MEAYLLGTQRKTDTKMSGLPTRMLPWLCVPFETRRFRLNPELFLNWECQTDDDILDLRRGCVANCSMNLHHAVPWPSYLD